MLVEGIDNVVLVSFTVLIIAIPIFMLTYLKDKLLSISQLNPILHSDVINDIINFRNRLQGNGSGTGTNANDEEEEEEVLVPDPSAPPMPPSQQTQTLSQNQFDARNSQIQCPICLTTPSVLPVETNCKHCFCSRCVVQYWQHSTDNILHAKMKCPMCRTEVTYLLPLYSAAEQRAKSAEFKETFELTNTYNRRFSGMPKSLWDQINEIPLLLRHIINELFSFNNMEIWFRIRFGFMLLMSLTYLLSPLDFIPEAIFGIFGFIDDILVFLVIALYACTVYRQIISQR